MKILLILYHIMELFLDVLEVMSLPQKTSHFLLLKMVML
nr:MAG TPA: hypothetical protein [Crassvirales sp.]